MNKFQRFVNAASPCNALGTNSPLLSLLLVASVGVASIGATLSCDSKTSEAPSAGAAGSPMGKQEPSAKSVTPAATSGSLPSASAKGDTKKPATAQLWDFEDAAPGALPKDWTASKGTWQTVALEKAPSGMKVLAQVAKSRGPIFNVALAAGEQPADIDVHVQFRARGGKIDQGGGVVWRAQDAKNYYVVRYNPLEDNYRVYIVENGRRKKLASADVSRSDADSWYTLRVTMLGDQITAYLNGKKHMEVKDTTFTKPGQVGLWTKADAQTEFDTLTVVAAAAR